MLLYFISSVLLGKLCSSYFKGGEKLVSKFSNLFRPLSIKVTGLSFEPSLLVSTKTPGLLDINILIPKVYGEGQGAAG